MDEGGQGVSQMNKFEEFQGLERGRIPMLVGEGRQGWGEGVLQ